MELKIVTKETAILAKELEFMELVGYYYKISTISNPITLEKIEPKQNINELLLDTIIAAPEQELLAKWLRDEKQMDIEVSSVLNIDNDFKKAYIGIIAKELKGDENDEPGIYFDVYEDALEHILIKALEYLKNKVVK